MKRVRLEQYEFYSRITVAARVLADGGVVAYPTEGVFGLGCRPDDARAITRILRIKRRSWRKGLALIAASLDQIAPLVILPSTSLREDIAASWPGPVTWVLRARPSVSRLITGGRPTVAVRVTAHPLARDLCLKAGSALVSTSANRSACAPLLTGRSVRRLLGAELDYVLHGPLGGLAGPTPIRDGATGAFFRGR